MPHMKAKSEAEAGSKGIVYVLINEAMPGYTKIGRTTNLEQRLQALYRTPVPLPFECVYAAEVDNPPFIEQKLHDTFDDHRVSASREFFRISPERVVSALQLAPHKDVTPRRDYVETDEDQRALDEARERRANFNFEMVDIPVGAILNFTRDQSITCIVADRRHVDFEGEATSISVAAQKALGKIGVNWKAVQGPLYWQYKGETLDERRRRYEEGE